MNKEFKIGDYIPVVVVESTLEGKTTYKSMAAFCNEPGRGLVMKEGLRTEGEMTFPVYEIAEPEPLPEVETLPGYEPSPAPVSNADIQRQLDEHTLILADLIGGRR